MKQAKKITKLRKTRESGIALFMVLIVMFILTMVTYELMSTGRVEVSLSLNARDRVQAHYLAKSAVRFSMLRLLLWAQAKNLLDTGQCGTNNPAAPMLGNIASQLDQIWSMPLPELPMPGMKNQWPGKMTATLESEGSKIPINLLDGDENFGSSPEIANEIKTQILDLINGKLQQEEFEKQYKGLKPEDLINPLIDWVDKNEEGSESGDENREYQRRKPPYKAKNGRMSSLNEIYLLENWNDDLFQKLGSHFSVLKNNVKVNPNNIPIDRLRAIDQNLENADLQKLQERRMLQPFGTVKELEGYIQAELKSGYAFKFPEYMVKNTTLDQDILLINASGIVGKAIKTLRLSVKIDRERAKKAAPVAAGQTPPTTPDDGKGDLCKCGQSGKDICKLKAPRILMVEEVL